MVSVVQMYDHPEVFHTMRCMMLRLEANMALCLLKKIRIPALAPTALLHEGVADGLWHFSDGQILLHIGALPALFLDLKGQSHVLAQGVSREPARLQTEARVFAPESGGVLLKEHTSPMHFDLTVHKSWAAFWNPKTR